MVTNLTSHVISNAMQNVMKVNVPITETITEVWKRSPSETLKLLQKNSKMPNIYVWGNCNKYLESSIFENCVILSCLRVNKNIKIWLHYALILASSAENLKLLTVSKIVSIKKLDFWKIWSNLLKPVQTIFC